MQAFIIEENDIVITVMPSNLFILPLSKVFWPHIAKYFVNCSPNT